MTPEELAVLRALLIFVGVVGGVFAFACVAIFALSMRALQPRSPAEPPWTISTKEGER